MDIRGSNCLDVRDKIQKVFKNDPRYNEDNNKRAFIAEHLEKDRPRRKTLLRCMSAHVGSRWYRAPEICLIERQYDQSSDIWSFACIIYELIQYTLKDIFNNFTKKRYLFKGTSCFPLSPCKEKEKPEPTTSKNITAKIGSGD